MKRIIATLLCLILTLSLLGVQTSAHSLGGTMLKPEDLTDTKISQRGDMGFWHQLSVKRKDVKTITFLSSTSTAPRNVLDFSANGDLSVMGWIENGNVYVATDGQIALNEDSSYLFSGMRNLTKINFNGVVYTGRVKYMDHMFQGCEKLEEIDLNGFDTSKVVDMTAMFYDCKDLDELDVSGFDTSKVESMKNMFTSCQNLEDLDLSALRTPELQDMSAMFDSCKSLETVNLRNFDTSKVTAMANLFGSCASLTSIDLSSFDTGKVQSMSAMFAGCGSLTSLNLSGFTTKKNPTLYKMFQGVGRLNPFVCSDEAIVRAYRNG